MVEFKFAEVLQEFFTFTGLQVTPSRNHCTYTIKELPLQLLTLLVIQGGFSCHSLQSLIYHHWISREQDGEPAPRKEQAISTSSPLCVVMSCGTSVNSAATERQRQREMGLKGQKHYLSKSLVTMWHYCITLIHEKNCKPRTQCWNLNKNKDSGKSGVFNQPSNDFIPQVCLHCRMITVMIRLVVINQFLNLSQFAWDAHRNKREAQIEI